MESLVLCYAGKPQGHSDHASNCYGCQALFKETKTLLYKSNYESVIFEKSWKQSFIVTKGGQENYKAPQFILSK